LAHISDGGGQYFPDLLNKLALGAGIYAEAQDYGWMYQHSFEDLDGHQWEIVYMDETQLPQNNPVAG